MRLDPPPYQHQGCRLAAKTIADIYKARWH